MSLPKLEDQMILQHKEIDMELFAGMPEWLVWCAAGAAGAIALATLASILDATFDLDAN
jgi:hypothetical protein